VDDSEGSWSSTLSLKRPRIIRSFRDSNLGLELSTAAVRVLAIVAIRDHLGERPPIQNLPDGPRPVADIARRVSNGGSCLFADGRLDEGPRAGV
jgi:hypothetical protein